MLVTLRALGSVSAAAIKYHRPFSTKQEDTNQLRPRLADICTALQFRTASGKSPDSCISVLVQP